jgi:oxygen-independent coproporphyrinogen III oxidase
MPSSLPPTPSCLMTGLAMDSMRAEGVLAVLASCAGQPLGFREWDSRHVVQNRYSVPAHEKIQAVSGAAELVIRTEAAFADISPDFLALMCLRADPGGVARTTVADIGETIGDLSARAREYLAQPWYAFERDNYDCVIDGRALTKSVPVLRERNGRPSASSGGSGRHLSRSGEARRIFYQEVTLNEPIKVSITAPPPPVTGNLQSLLGIEECIRYYPPNLEAAQDPAAALRNEAPSRPDREIGVFLDVPFCSTICGFCPFNVYPYAGAEVGAYLRGVEKEIHVLKALHDFSTTRVRTVWVGGGTPSMLEDHALDSLLRLLHDNFDLSQLKEFTVEVKPTLTTLTDSKLGILHKHKVDRISMGVQSTSEEFLRILGRGYTPDVATQVIKSIKDAQFILNIDMMYRLPGQTHDQIQTDVDAVRSLGVDHLSWFPYVPHAGTPLAERIDRGRVVPPADRGEYFKMFNTVVERMTDAGYQQYTPYYFTQGNLCEYHVDRWRMPQLEILGVGAGAFSFFNGWIYTNEHNPAKYRQAVDDRKPPVMMAKKLSSTEWITRLAVLGTKFFTIDMEEFRQHSGGVRMDEFYEQELELLKKSGLVEIQENRVECTLLGKAFNNDVATILGTDTARRTKHPQAIDLMRVKL